MRPKKEEAGRKAKEAALERPSVPRDNHGMVDNNDVDVYYGHGGLLRCELYTDE